MGDGPNVEEFPNEACHCVMDPCLQILFKRRRDSLLLQGRISGSNKAVRVIVSHRRPHLRHSAAGEECGRAMGFGGERSEILLTRYKAGPLELVGASCSGVGYSRGPTYHTCGGVPSGETMTK